jgi:hypothetical protein
LPTHDWDVRRPQWALHHLLPKAHTHKLNMRNVKGGTTEIETIGRADLKKVIEL